MTERAWVRREAARFIVFAFGGLLATLTHAGMALLFFRWSDAYLASYFGGFAVAFLVSFTFHYLVTFRDAGVSVLTAAPRFFAVAATGCLLSLGAAAPLAAYSKPLSLVLGAVLIPIITYLGARIWAFVSRENDADQS